MAWANLVLISVVVMGDWKSISTESLTNGKLSNVIQDLSVTIYQPEEMEVHPLHEGFMLLPNENKKSVSTKKPIGIVLNNRTSQSRHLSSTTCRTIVTVTKPTTKRSSPSPKTLDHSVGHLGRRLLNEPDLEILSREKHVDDDDLMNIDMEELSKGLLRFDATFDGSGEGMLKEDNILHRKILILFLS